MDAERERAERLSGNTLAPSTATTGEVSHTLSLTYVTVPARHGDPGQVSGVPADVPLPVQGEEQRAGHHLRERGDRPAEGRHREHEGVQGAAGLHGTII